MDTTRSLHWSGDVLMHTERTDFHFEADMSKGTLGTKITTLDFALLSSTNQRPTSTGPQKVFLTTNISDYFFKGFRALENADGILNWKLRSSTGSYAMLPRNADSTPRFTVNTKPGFVNQILEVDNKTDVSHYKSSCSNLPGKVAGIGLLPAFSLPPRSVTVYEPSLCVPWTLRRGEQYNFAYEPIARFVGGRHVFNATKKNCWSENATGINGTFDATPYYSYLSKSTNIVVPAVLSYPHFLYGDPALFAGLHGLAPKENRHGFYIDVHAPSGVVVDMRVRSQINMKVRVPTKKSSREVILPVFWQEISRLPEDKAKMVAAVKSWAVFPGWVAFACSLSLLAAALLLGVSLLLYGPVNWCDLDEDKTPHTPDDIPTDELSSEPEEDLRREQRRRALRARLPAGLPVYFKIHEGDLDDLGVTIPDWVMEKLQRQMEEQSSTSEDSSDELPSAVESTTWSTVSSASTSPEPQEDENKSAPELTRSRTSSGPAHQSWEQQKPATPDPEEDVDQPEDTRALEEDAPNQESS